MGGGLWENDDQSEGMGLDVEMIDPDAPPPTFWKNIVRLHYPNFDFYPIWDIPGLSNAIQVGIDDFLEAECNRFELEELRKSTRKMIPARLNSLFVLWFKEVGQVMVEDAKANQQMFWQDAVRKFFPEFIIPNSQINDDHRAKYSKITKAVNEFFSRECTPEELEELEKMPRKRIPVRLLKTFTQWFGAPEQQSQFRIETLRKEVIVWSDGMWMVCIRLLTKQSWPNNSQILKCLPMIERVNLLIQLFITTFKRLSVGSFLAFVPRVN